MSTISAAELKRCGVSALAPTLAADGDAVITVRGKAKYVVMSIDTYSRLREAELDLALREARADYAAGRVADDSIASHMKRLDHGV